MDKLGGLSPAVSGPDSGREDELESLGLGLFDVDVDLAECFENCPEWNVSAYIGRSGCLVQKRLYDETPYS